MEDQVGIFDQSGGEALLLESLRYRAKLHSTNSLSSASEVPDELRLTVTHPIGNLSLDGDLKVTNESNAWIWGVMK